MKLHKWQDLRDKKMTTERIRKANELAKKEAAKMIDTPITLPDGRVVSERLYQQRFVHRESLWKYVAVHPCIYCLRPALCPGKECDSCWEVTTRLDMFLREGGEAARERLLEALKAGT